MALLPQDAPWPTPREESGSGATFVWMMYNLGQNMEKLEPACHRELPVHERATEYHESLQKITRNIA